MKQLKEFWTPKRESRLVGTVVVLAAGALFLAILSGQPAKALESFFIQPLTTALGWQRMINHATVYILVALGVCAMYQCRQYSLISEGSFMGGACAATFFMLNSNTRTSGYVIVVGILFAVLVGGLIAVPSAVLSARHQVNVTLSSAIVDFFVLEMASFILEQFLSDPSVSTVQSFAIPSRMQLPYLYQPLGIRVSTVLALLFAFVAWLVLYRTRTGYTLRMVGASQQTAGYLGLSSGRVIIFSQLFAGVMAGLGGAVQMMGVSSRYAWAGEFSNVGLIAIMVALFADCNPAWVPVSAVLFSYFTAGGTSLSEQLGFAAEWGGVCQAGLVLAVLLVSYLRKKQRHLAGKKGQGLKAFWQNIIQAPGALAAKWKEGGEDGTV